MLASIKQQPKWAAIALLALIAFQATGWLAAWKGLQFEAKIEAREALLKHRSTFLQKAFHKDFIQKINVEEQEILLEGQLYDYQVVSTSGDSITISIYPDYKEQALLSLLGQVFKAGADGNGLDSIPMGLWLAKWIGLVFLPNEKPALVSVLTPVYAPQNFVSHCFKPQAAPWVFTPPPKVLG